MDQEGAEARRLIEDAKREKNWKRWGPYLAERQWGTVREDYSEDGSSWESFPHDQARARAYRWGEDGLLGITDRQCRLCFALALWNGKDPILKERMFGLSNSEGNHGEDVKEYYFYLDSTPTHSYMKALYKYPQAEYPYRHLVEENRRRGPEEPEYELLDTGIFDDNRYFDVFVEYAKASPDDIRVRITIFNRGPDPASLEVLPTLWFKNSWSWGREGESYWPKPSIERTGSGDFLATHDTLGQFRLIAESVPGIEPPACLFTENETNTERLFGSKNAGLYVKDAFHAYVIEGKSEAVNPDNVGTKAAFHYRLDLAAGESKTLQLRLVAEEDRENHGPADVFGDRLCDADEYDSLFNISDLSPDERRVVRQSRAGLLWSKQFYHYGVADWLAGDPAQPPLERHDPRNPDWPQLYNRDIISMPDKWEYPWYATWDLAFHMISMAKVDPYFAKEQLVLFLREWYLHPNGALPAYEFNFSDVNPPVHAWACWRVYKLTGPKGQRDRFFLGRVFQKLLLNFTWWVNRKDTEGKNIFGGGFLGLDNIGVFDRSKPLPVGGTLQQADGTAWMAFYCATMLAMALELASEDPTYEDMASKFFEHFIGITDAINTLGGTGLWDEVDGFYYDQLRFEQSGTCDKSVPLKVRSLVGLVPLFAVEVLEEEVIESLAGFLKRKIWFIENRPDLARSLTLIQDSDGRGRLLLAIPSRERLERVLRYLLDEAEFLSPFGIRSVSQFHRDNPYTFRADDSEYSVSYVPGESNNRLFGGNSNWRGPVWFPLNYLLVEALERYSHFYGDDLKVECPTGSGVFKNLQEVATEIGSRLTRIFIPDENGRCPWHGEARHFSEDPHWRDLTLFHEYFHGDTGQGLGASHQTGWTSLVSRLTVGIHTGRNPSGSEAPALPPLDSSL